jgi:hypothetical protein
VLLLAYVVVHDQQHPIKAETPNQQASTQR